MGMTTMYASNTSVLSINPVLSAEVKAAYDSTHTAHFLAKKTF